MDKLEKTKHIYPWTERFLTWPAGKNQKKWHYYYYDPGLRRDGWVCTERSDLLRGERFTDLKKQWTKVTGYLSARQTQILPKAETCLLGTELTNDTAEIQKVKVHLKIKHSLVIIIPKIHWII